MPQPITVCLTVVDGKHKNRGIRLPPTFFVIGRDKRCHLRPHCKLVSRIHCAIASWTGRVLVRDLKSANGTFVNDRRIQGEVAVRDGDVLRIGNLVFVVNVATGGGMAPVSRKSDVQWLLDSPDNAPMLQSDCDTSCEIGVPGDETLSEAGMAGQPNQHLLDHVGMSAGDYLREFFNQP